MAAMVNEPLWAASAIASAVIAVKTSQQVYADYQRFKVNEPECARIWVLVRQVWAERLRLFQQNKILSPLRAWYIDRFLSLRTLKCRACGWRSKVSGFPYDGDKITLEWLPVSRLLKATCPRCKAFWPEAPIFDADQWAPVVAPLPQGDPENQL